MLDRDREMRIGNNPGGRWCDRGARLIASHRGVGEALHGDQKVLVTGAAGQIGAIIRDKLGFKYDLTGIDRVDNDWLNSHVADISDLDALMPAFEGQHTVMHLGGDPRVQAPWESILQNNIVGIRNVYEAAKLAGVERVIFASTNHVVGFYPLRQDPYKAIYDGRLDEVEGRSPCSTTKTYGPTATTASAKRSANRWAATSMTSTDFR